MVGFYIFYKVCFKTSVKVKKVTKTVDFINSSQTLVCFHIHHKNSSLFLMHDLEKIKNLNRDRRISACPLGKQLTHFAFPGPLLARLRGCTHLVFVDQCLSTNTNSRYIHTLSTRYATVCIVTHFSLSDAILKHELRSECKAVDCPRTNKKGVHTQTWCPLWNLKLGYWHCS